MDNLQNITLHLTDCMDILRTMTDGAFDLAIVDPPYGISEKCDNTLQMQGSSAHNPGNRIDFTPRKESRRHSILAAEEGWCLKY